MKLELGGRWCDSSSTAQDTLGGKGIRGGHFEHLQAKIPKGKFQGHNPIAKLYSTNS